MVPADVPDSTEDNFDDEVHVAARQLVAYSTGKVPYVQHSLLRAVLNSPDGPRLRRLVIIGLNMRNELMTAMLYFQHIMCMWILQHWNDDVVVQQRKRMKMFQRDSDFRRAAMSSFTARRGLAGFYTAHLVGLVPALEDLKRHIRDKRAAPSTESETDHDITTSDDDDDNDSLSGLADADGFRDAAGSALRPAWSIDNLIEALMTHPDVAFKSYGLWLSAFSQQVMSGGDQRAHMEQRALAHTISEKLQMLPRADECNLKEQLQEVRNALVVVHNELTLVNAPGLPALPGNDAEAGPSRIK